MTVTNLAVAQQINLATVLNTKLEKPLLQSEMGLDVAATAIKQAVRWNEFTAKHDNAGNFKAGIINQADVALTTSATATQKPIRWDEFTKRHNNDGTIKQLNYKKSSIANPSATAATNGTVVDLIPATNYSALNPMAVDVVFGGTFGTETVTADITVIYSDATTATITKTATAVGTTSLTGTDLMTLAKDGVYINKISVKSKSSIASSTATVTFNHFGIYL